MSDPNYPPGSTHDSESQHTLAARLGREQQMAAWEHANELEDEPRTYTPEEELEIRHTNDAVRFDRCIEAHRSDVYCSGCRPACTPDDGWGHRVTPDDIPIPEPVEVRFEVGSFDIGKVRDRLLETEEIRQDMQDIGGDNFNRVTVDVQEIIDEVSKGLVGVDEMRESVFSGDKGPGFEARLKNMEGKAPMSLLSPIFLEGIASVLAYGSKKYAPNMWRDDPMTFTAELDSIFRHLFAFLRCEDYDAAPPSGSGLLHLFNAGCRLMFLTERYFTHPELDDRYPAPGLDDEMFQKEMHEGAEAQYKEQLDSYSRSELYDIIDNLHLELAEECNVQDAH